MYSLLEDSFRDILLGENICSKCCMEAFMKECKCFWLVLLCFNT